MKKLVSAAAATVLAASLAVSACGCTKKIEYFDRMFYTMGTFATLVVADVDGNGALSEQYTQGREAAFSELEQSVSEFLYSAEQSLSTTINTSCIYAFNAADAGATVEIDKTAYEVLTLAQSVYTSTEGYYNPAVYDTVALYGFPLKNGIAPSSLPEEEYVSAFRELASHFNQVSVKEEGGKYYATKPQYTATAGGKEYSLKLDLGGVGKGWCVDKVSAMMRERGYTKGYFNFGSSSISFKEYAGSDSKNFVLELRDPRVENMESCCSVEIKNANLSTSGDYDQYYEIEGERYCHIINPFTGKPIETGVASVTVVGGNAAEDDALTTALSCMGKSKAVDFINNNLADKTVIMLVFEGGAGKIITNRPNDIKIINGNYRIANTVDGNGKIVLNDVA